MTHIRRDHAPGVPHHVISRLAVTGTELLIETDRQRANYLLRVGATAARTDWTPLAYALMGNHIHWILVAGFEPLHRFTRPINCGFALWYNPEHRRRGPMFAKRPSSFAMWWQKLFDSVAYVHNNPVRAGVVADAAECSWTSHRAFLGLEPPPPWLDVARTLELCGFDATAEGRAEFARQVSARGADARDPVLSGRVSDEFRTEVRGLLGSPVEISTALPGPDGPGHGLLLPEGSAMNPRWPVAPTDIVEAAAAALNLDARELRGRSRRRVLARGRRLAVLVGTRELGLSVTEMGASMGISASAATRLLTRRPQDVQELTPRAAAIGKALRAAVSAVAHEVGSVISRGPMRAVP